MSIANYLVNLADGLNSDGVIGASKGGTGLTSPGLAGKALVSDGTLWTSQTVASGSPKVSAIGYTGDNTAANPAGGETITLTGTGFSAGARILINTTQVSVVTVVSATQITFTAPVLATGSYILYVVNTDGATAILVPGIQYSGVPAWTTAAGTLGTLYEATAISASVAATSDSAVTYSLFSGTLPAGVTIASNGTISGTIPTVANPTTYTFVIRATDVELQDTDRTFSLTINPDIVTWSTPANNTTYSSYVGIAISTITLSSASAAGKAITYTTDALPTGISISGTSITGTPTTTSSISTLLTATAATTNKTATRTIIWNIFNVPTYLVVGGGGGGGGGDGGTFYGGGGGGGGGVNTGTFSWPPPPALVITVAAGGTSSTSGGNSSISAAYAAAGGTGGAGAAGAHGAGGTSGNGYGPGAGWGDNGWGSSGGGAAGAGYAYYDATYPRKGGPGVLVSAVDMYGTDVSNLTDSVSGKGYYGGGGGGGHWYIRGNGPGGIGGGGRGGGPDISTSGLTNTGGGGGGGQPGSNIGSPGGSGLVVIRYPTTLPAATSVTGGTYTVSSGYRRYVFTSSGSITF